MKHGIDEPKLLRRLEEAIRKAIGFTRPIVHQSLSDSALVLLEPNSSYDGNQLEDDEQIFPEDSLAEGTRLGPLSPEEAAHWLWRERKVPEWVNLRAFDADEMYSYILLESCGRFTALEKHLYHRHEGYSPFHVTSPVLPPGWESVELDGPFDIEGQRQQHG